MNFAIKSMHSRRAQIALCAVLTCLAGSAFADQTHITYNLGPGGSRAMAIPATNTPVQVSCTQNQPGYIGEGQVVILRAVTDGLLHWTGFDYFEGAFSRGDSATSGAHIIYCDGSGYVDLEVVNGTEILIKNSNSITQTGVVMFVF